VLDVPAKLAARARVFDTGQGRKTDAAKAPDSLAKIDLVAHAVESEGDGPGALRAIKIICSHCLQKLVRSVAALVGLPGILPSRPRLGSRPAGVLLAPDALPMGRVVRAPGIGCCVRTRSLDVFAPYQPGRRQVPGFPGQVPVNAGAVVGSM
jgi:hypothetical protein